MYRTRRYIQQASSSGCYKLSLDGKTVAPAEHFTPGWGTLPTVRQPFNMYDVTSLLTGVAVDERRHTHHAGQQQHVLDVSLGMCK